MIKLMIIHFFGTCAGTEPMPGRRHVSFAIETRGDIYWFDAGEGCSYTAHLMNVDLQSVRCVFISHTHMDHVGGLGNLFWNIRKLSTIYNKIKDRQIELFIPNLKTWEGIKQVLENTEGGFQCSFTINTNQIKDGELYNQNGFRVTALHNNHIPKKEGEPWRSFSFLIETEGKRVVYSGDVKSVEDIAPLIDDCDLLLMETGHHKVEDICNYIKEKGKKVKMLGFIHHGRDILLNSSTQLQKAKDIFSEQVFITEDGTSLELK